MKAIAGAFAVSLLLASTSAGQTRDNYIDYYVVKVKPERRADFDGVAKKIADANRRANGDRWLAYEAVYGETNTVYFASTRKDMAAIDTATENFMRAMKESLGPNFEAIFREMDSCTSSGRGEIRLRRWDLDTNVPEDQDQLGKRIGEARYVRTMMFRIRPGHGPHFEELLRTVGKANAKRTPNVMTSVSQAVAGQMGSVYYVTQFQPALGGFDPPAQSLRETLGDAEYQQFQKGLAEDVLTSEVTISKFLPALSNPPDAILNASPAYWKTGPAGTADRMAKPKGKK